MTEPIDCRSPEGLVVSLIDTLILISRFIKENDLDSKAVTEALRDLKGDEGFSYVLNRVKDVNDEIARMI